MLKKLQPKQNRNGFTLIEVLIVLAIAGLIMGVVFLAIPNLKRSQRNTARKTDANNALSALTIYAGDNGNNLPAADCTGTSCSFLDPSSGTKLGYFDPTPASNDVKYFKSTTTWSNATPIVDQLFLIAGATCSGGAASAPTAGTFRQVAAYFGIEGGVPTQCVSE